MFMSVFFENTTFGDRHDVGVRVVSDVLHRVISAVTF